LIASVSGLNCERAAEPERDGDLRARDERERLRVRVVAAREVAVERRDDDVGLAFRDVVALPLADARAARVREHLAADRFERVICPSRRIVSWIMSLPGVTRKRLFMRTPVRGRLARDVGRARDVFVARVRAAADERGRDAIGPARFLRVGGELGDRTREIGRVRTDDVRLELRQVDLDDLVVEPLGLSGRLGVAVTSSRASSRGRQRRSLRSRAE
jgi:hypothetical protein